MKSLLYVAAALMVGASIYGFVDYSKTSHQKEFKTMYDDNETDDLVTVKEKTDKDGIVSAVNKEEVKPETAKKESESGVSDMIGKLVKKIKKKRSVNYKSFSRAPLREEVIVVPEIKDVKLKEQ